jgi:hypothetical protein
MQLVQPGRKEKPFWSLVMILFFLLLRPRTSRSALIHVVIVLVSTFRRMR